jgi:hypothetical protein
VAEPGALDGLGNFCYAEFSKNIVPAGNFFLDFLEERLMIMIENIHVRRSRSGLGLFVSVPVKKGTTIIEYIGERIPASEGSTRDNRYIFSVNSRFDIDGSPRYNTARYINHSCRPNCEAVNRRGRIFIVAKKNIAAEEELSYHYGKDHFEGLIQKAGCRCKKCSP